MRYEKAPVIDVRDLADALNLQYGTEWDGPDLATFLFGDDYPNAYMRYCFGSLPTYTGRPWENEDEISRVNAIKIYLQDIFPDYGYVIIDVSW